VDDIVSYSVSRISGYDLTFSVWEKSLFKTNRLRDLKIAFPEGNICLTAEQAEIFFDISKYLAEKELSLDLFFTGLTLSEIKDADDGKNVLYDLFIAKAQKFSSVRLNLSVDNGTFSVSDIKADSRNIKMSGNCVLSNNWETADIDIKISISPSLADIIEDNIKKQVLFKLDNGWYATVINYEGNTVLLRALYHLSKDK
jgi:hypothetical protein